MSHRGPVVTLLTGVAVAGALLALSARADGAAQAREQVARDTPLAAAPDGATTASSGATPAPGGTATAPSTAPERPPADLDATWAGPVDGDGTTIAIVAEGDVAVAYLCDGQRLETWLQGTAADGQLALTGTNASLAGTFGDGRAEGTVTVDGQRFGFDVPAVDDPSGLYRATDTVRGARVVGGWIVLPDGSQVGLATVDGAVVRPSRVDPDTGAATVAGTTVRATPAIPGTTD